jgi:hypothetical protein
MNQSYYDKNRGQILENLKKRRRNELLGIRDNSISDEATLSEMFRIFKSNQKLFRAAKRRSNMRKYIFLKRSKLNSAIVNPGNIRAKLIRAKRNFDRKQKNGDTIKYNTVYINDGYQVVEYDLQYLTFQDECINDSKNFFAFEESLQFLEQLDNKMMVEKKHGPISIEEHQHELKITSVQDTISNIVRSNILPSDEEEEEDEDQDQDEYQEGVGFFKIIRPYSPPQEEVFILV